MAISQRISDVRLTPQFEGFTLCLGHASGAFARAIAHLFRIRSIVDTQTTVVYFADASGFMEVRAMVCLPQETYQSFASQSSPEPTAPALERGRACSCANRLV